MKNKFRIIVYSISIILAFILVFMFFYFKFETIYLLILLFVLLLVDISIFFSVKEKENRNELLFNKEFVEFFKQLNDFTLEEIKISYNIIKNDQLKILISILINEKITFKNIYNLTNGLNDVESKIIKNIYFINNSTIKNKKEYIVENKTLLSLIKYKEKNENYIIFVLIFVIIATVIVIIATKFILK